VNRVGTATRTPGTPGFPNILTVDVEEYFHPNAMDDAYGPNDWDRLPSRVESNTQRLLDLLSEFDTQATFFVLGWVAERFPELIALIASQGHEIASHGLKWIDYRNFTAEAERAHIHDAIRIHTEVAGERPLGFYQGRTSMHTLGILMSEGGFLYSADSYADELPYWVKGPRGPHLIVPYTLDANDMRFATAQGFNSGEQFFAYLKDTFDLLYAEGGAGQPKMLSVGLHCRLVGRPGRAAALARFLDYVERHDRVWVARRIDIARHWIDVHPAANFLPAESP